MFRHDVLLGSLLVGTFINLGCQPLGTDTPRPLPAIFPDAARALGPFTIHLEKSRNTNVLSEARIKMEQGSGRKHVTLQLKMMESQEQVTLRFVPQGSESLDQNGSCASFVMDPLPTQNEYQEPARQDTGALLQIPLPRSVRNATDVQVTGLGSTWALAQDSLVWSSHHEAQTIALSWTHEQVPQVRYPLQTAEAPQNLQARRVESDREKSIPVEWQDGYVWIPSEDVKPGAWLELRYDIPGDQTTFTLPQMPVYGHMNILALQGNCSRDDFLLERAELSWACPPAQGNLWAASYSYNYVNGAWHQTDWPELEKNTPGSVSAHGDAGEKLDVKIQGRNHFVPHIPVEASRVCLHKTWSSDLPR